MRRSASWIGVVIAACGAPDAGAPRAVGSDAGELPGRGADAAYVEASDATGVPAALLQAVALAETGMRMVVGEEEFPGRPRAFGVMGLREDHLDEAAALAGVDPMAARFDLDANVLAAAAWLAAEAARQGITTGELGAWAPVVAAYSGIDEPEARASYVHDAVYARLRSGAALEGGRLPKHDVEPDFPRPTTADRLGVDASGVIWRPSPNFNGRGGANVDFVVLHSCEGVYSGCWGWLVNSASGVSAHYVVKEDGSEVSQLVAESDRAWHISASYDCANNDGVECWRDGTSMNTVSVGIEHAGYASQSSWDPDLIQVSAELTCGITQRQGVPRDRYHIVAHGKLQPWNRTDPGPNWPWTDYLDRVDQACGEDTTPPEGQLVIDSNDAANEPGRTRFEASSAWVGSTNVGGYWNTGYVVAPTEAVSDPARFHVHLDAPTCFDVEAWWTAASDRTQNATYLALGPTGAEIGRRTVDQRASGGQWNLLGTWAFPDGWSQIALSRWTAVGAYVVADAVRLTPSDACPSVPPPTDGDGDGTPDASDGCPADAGKTEAGDCGCGVSDVDLDGDGVSDCDADCGDGVIQSGEGCDDGGAAARDGCDDRCRVEDLVMLPIVPGTAGVVNTLEVRGARPGAAVTWFAARRVGTSIVPGCPGLTMPLRTAMGLAQAVAGDDTHATRTGTPPASLAGSAWRFVAVDHATCRVSQVVRETF